MEAWVLIFWLVFDRGGGPSTAEFSTKERCETAAKAIFGAGAYSIPYSRNDRNNSGGYVCVPK